MAKAYAALVIDHIVTNSVIYDDDSEAPEGYIPCPKGVGKGWGYDGSIFTPPAAPVVNPDPRNWLNLAHASQVYTCANGAIIQCRPHPYPDESNMMGAINYMQANSVPTRRWIAADNSGVDVTVADLQGAIDAGRQQSSANWDAFFAMTGL